MKKLENATLSKKNVGETVELCGWVAKKRNLGGLLFIDLRDRSGIIQLVVRPENSVYEIAETVRNEYVLKVVGTILERESKNSNLATGEIEVQVESLTILNTSLELPFEISEDTTALEDTRLKYRYLDLRRTRLQEIMKLRHKITLATRNFLDRKSVV